MVVQQQAFGDFHHQAVSGQAHGRQLLVPRLAGAAVVVKLHG